MIPRLLIVEDDPSSAFAIEAIAQETATIRCDIAQTGEEAIELVKSHEYFLIFMDFCLPGMNGFEVARRIKELLPSPTPIAFVSGVATDEKTQLEGYRLGAVDYLVKPVCVDRLSPKILTFYRLYQSRQQLHRDLNRMQSLSMNSGQLLDMSGDGIIGFDRQMMVTYANIAAQRMLCVEVDELIGSSLQQFMAHNLNERQWQESDTVQYFLQGESTHSTTQTFWRWTGEFFPVEFSQTILREGDQITGGVLTFRDNTEKVQVEERLASLSSTDHLTGLLNRRSFYELLEQDVAAYLPRNKTFSLLLIDIDNFKAINDNFGHLNGDALLEQFGDRVKTLFDQAVLISRIGGDEFAVTVNNANEQLLAQHAELAARELRMPYFVNDREVYCSVSIGIALFPKHGRDLTSLISAADTAMFLAKQAGKDGFCFFDATAQQTLNEKFRMSVNLRKAKFDDEFSLVYQPKFNIQTMKMSGVEALIRWNNPTLGQVPPSKFIPVAESIGSINEITQWALRKAIGEAKQWNENSGMTIPLRVAVNASPLDLKHSTFVQHVLNMIYLDRLNPTWIELEVTESAVMENPQAAIKVLKDLKQHGIRVSIDDFGTGYSSLNHLKSLPLDYLKVDQSFVRDIGIDPNDEKIIRAIIQLAHSLELQVIAEGIETIDQLKFLRDLGCEYGQGYYFSKPVPAEDVPALFSEHNR